MIKASRSRFAVSLAAIAAFSMVATPAFADGWHRRRHSDRIDGGDVLLGAILAGGIIAIAGAAKKQKERRERTDGAPDYDFRGDEQDESADDAVAYPGGPGRDGRYADPRDDYPEGAMRPGPMEPGPMGSGMAGIGNFDAAVDTCRDELDRGERRVASVDHVARDRIGYRVDGRMSDERVFACTVSEEGRIIRVAIDGRAI